jgi:D-psicose/D-tagatose/L-ribulose 3-epimerase
MKLGMNMLLWSDDVTGERYLPTFELLKELGYDGVEIPIFALAPGPYERLGERLRELGLEPIGDTARGEAASAISSDPEVRLTAVRENVAALDCTQALGATVVVGPFQTGIGVFTGKGPTADEWAWAVEALGQVAEAADERGITLAIEPLNRFEQYLVNTAADAARLCREVGHPRCRMTYDSFHAHIEEKDVRAAIEACRDRLEYVHVSENDRSTPGRGQVDWDATFGALRAIGYDGWLTIEAFGDALPALAAATKIWRRMFDSEEQLARDGARFVRGRWAAA